MPVFFVYASDGAEFSMDDMECAPNAEVVKRQLASRVRTGRGRTRLVVDMDEISPRAAYKSGPEDEWPPATDNACMVVWRVRSWNVPTGQPDEIWQFSGQVDNPRIIPVDPAETVPQQTPRTVSKPRVSDDVIRRRMSMGWDAERARTTPLGPRRGSVQDRFASSMKNQGGSIEGTVRGTLGKAPEVFSAFGMTRSAAEWRDLTSISEEALRRGARKHGMEGYLRKKQWHPRWGKA